MAKEISQEQYNTMLELLVEANNRLAELHDYATRQRTGLLGYMLDNPNQQPEIEKHQLKWVNLDDLDDIMCLGHRMENFVATNHPEKLTEDEEEA